MIKLLEDGLGKKAQVENLPFHKADMMVTWADISKAKKSLTGSQQLALMRGLRGV
jgi:UDP-glucuronate 4-epimerase